MADATITAISPVNAKATDVVTITGTEFDTSVQANNKVWIGGVAATGVNASLATRMTCVVPAGVTGGLNDVGVANAGAGAAQDTLADGLYFFVAGTFVPDDVIRGALHELFVDGLFMGHTHGPLELEHGVETADIEVEQSLLPVRQVKISESFAMNVPLAEVSLDNIKEVWGASATITTAPDGRRVLTFGGETTIEEKSVLLRVPAGSGKRFDITMYRCIVVAPGTMSWSRDAQVDLPLVITALADTSRDVGDRVGVFEEYTAS